MKARASWGIRSTRTKNAQRRRASSNDQGFRLPAAAPAGKGVAHHGSSSMTVALAPVVAAAAGPTA